MALCLIVDDSRIVRKVAKKILEDLSFNCVEAENGEEALKFCQQSLPYLILLDWRMPGLNGLDFLKQLRALPQGGTPKVIFCTIVKDVSSIQEALEAGADEYIMKPFDGEILRDKLTQLGLLM